MKLGKRKNNQALNAVLFWAVTQGVMAEFLYGVFIVWNVVLLVTSAAVL
jgi:hypothetical protein